MPPKVEIVSVLKASAISGVAIVTPQRHAVGDALGHRHDVGLDAPVLDAEHLAAGAAEAGLHLVADEDAAVLAHDVDRDLEVLRRRRDEAADALDRLGEEAGDLARWSWSGSAPRCPCAHLTSQLGYSSPSGQR